jgi:hypothetical protein
MSSQHLHCHGNQKSWIPNYCFMYVWLLMFWKVYGMITVTKLKAFSEFILLLILSSTTFLCFIVVRVNLRRLQRLNLHYTVLTVWFRERVCVCVCARVCACTCSHFHMCKCVWEWARERIEWDFGLLILVIIQASSPLLSACVTESVL